MPSARGPARPGQEWGDYDLWSAAGPGGEWRVPAAALPPGAAGRAGPGAGARPASPWQRWLRRASGGRLGPGDVPEGTLSPWLKAYEVRREVRRRRRRRPPPARAERGAARGLGPSSAAGPGARGRRRPGSGEGGGNSARVRRGRGGR